MSNSKGGLGGLFVNKKAAAASAPASTVAQPKNVKQRWMIVGVGAIGFIVLASSFMSKKQEPVAASKEKPAVLVSPGNLNGKEWIATATQNLTRLDRENADLKGQLATQAAQIKALQTDKSTPAPVAVKPAVELPPSVVAPPMPNGAPGNAGATAAIPVPPAPPKPPMSAGGISAPPAGMPTMAADVMPVAQEPRIFKPEAKAAAVAPAGEDAVKAKVKYTKNPYSGFLPAGAFAPVALLNGLDAGTSTSTQANPLPVLMTVTDYATLPGTAKYSIKSCFVLGTGYGDLSAERVYVRYSRMSCVDKRDRLVLSADVSGYLVDSDGKIGLRGKVVDRQGAKLGKAVLAGFAQGLSGAFSQAQGVMTTSAVGATTAIGGDAALRAAGLNGAQSAAQQLAQFYLKEAQAIFPVITVDAGRSGTIVFTDNASLTWSAGDGQYVKDVRPATSN